MIVAVGRTSDLGEDDREGELEPGRWSPSLLSPVHHVLHPVLHPHQYHFKRNFELVRHLSALRMENNPSTRVRDSGALVQRQPQCARGRE